MNIRRTKKQMTVDDLLENSTSIDKSDLDEIKKELERERVNKLLKRSK